MDYFKLTSGNCVRVTDMGDKMWTVDMIAEGEYASIYDDGLWYVPVSDIAYEISALDMAVYMLESMKQMDWADGDHIMTAITMLKDKFQDELEFDIYVASGKKPRHQIIRIDIRELDSYPNSSCTSVIWNYYAMGRGMFVQKLERKW